MVFFIQFPITFQFVDGIPQCKGARTQGVFDNKNLLFTIDMQLVFIAEMLVGPSIKTSERNILN